MTKKIQISRKDLEKLSHDDLLAIARETEKIKSSAKFRTLESYDETAHEKQIEFSKAASKHRMRFFLGGNRSGKSTAGVVESIRLATGNHPFHKKWKTPCKGLIVIQDFETHGKNILEPKIAEWCPQGEIVKIDRNQTGAAKKYYFKCGSILDVASHDQDIKVFEGTDYDFCQFDEPPPRKIFVAVWRGLTDRGGILFMTATPLMSPWLYKIYKKFQSGDPLIWFEMVKTMENAVNIGEGNAELGKKRIQEFASALDDDEKAARLDGEMAQMRGLVFKSWDATHHLIKPFPIPAHWKIYESIDPHPQKPWAISWTAEADSGQKILLRCDYMEGDIEDIASQILFGRSQLQIRGTNNPRIVRCLIDNYASVPLWQKSNTDPTAERLSVRQELENYIGPSVGGPQVEVAPKNIAQKIELFKGWLKIRDNLDGGVESHFYVFDTPENAEFVDEIEEYVWDESKDKKLKDKPKKINDDILDTIMQLALTLPKEMVEMDLQPVKVMEHKSWTVR